MRDFFNTGASLITILALGFAAGLSAQVEEDAPGRSVPGRSSVQKEQGRIYDFDQRFQVYEKKIPFELNWSLGVLQEAHNYENADLRETNSETDAEIRDTDDRQSFTVTRAKLDTLFTFPEQRLGLEVSLGFDGVWGHDQLQGFSNPGTRIGRANVFWNMQDSQGLASTLTVGRQYFAIGGIPYDYMQRDVLDAVVLDLSIKGVVEIRALLLDVYSGASNFGAGDGERWNDEFQFLTRDDGEIQEGQRGDVSTYRWGLVLSFQELFQELFSNKQSRLDPRLYGYYAAVRGNGGGSDRSENGAAGNFADDDWSALGGARLAYELVDLNIFQSLLFYADGALSTGKDLKREGEPEADYTAIGGGGGLRMETQPLFEGIALFWEVNGFYAEGPQHSALGNRTSHGFVSFKGDEIGGLLYRRYWGVHPSAYVDDDGIDETPYSANRKSGTLMGHVGFGLNFGSLWLIRLDVWHTQDTGETNVPFGDIIDGDPAADVAASRNPNLSREEIIAQEKLGKTLGQEINITLQYKPNDLLKFYTTLAYFARGEFYDDPVPEIAARNGVPAGDVSDTDFSGAAIGMELNF